MTEEVRLAPPGAGLPTLERLVAKTVLGLLRGTLGRQRIQRWMNAETQRVLRIAQSLPLVRLQRQVLIARPLGLEDSSRNWSPAMVLQHLVIVDSAIGGLITHLSGDRGIEREVRIAEVKPSPDAGPEQIERLEAELARYAQRVTAIGELRTLRRHAHPWFGQLDGLGWHTLAAVHTTIHRRQLESILRHE